MSYTDLGPWDSKGRKIKENKPMDTKTTEALEGSIEKWEKIVRGEGKDECDENCPLCKEFRNNDNTCTRCLIQKKTDHDGCVDTPFVEWYKHQKREHGEAPYFAVHCPTCKTLAQQEVDFLISLREPKEEEIKPQAGDVWMTTGGSYVVIHRAYHGDGIHCVFMDGSGTIQPDLSKKGSTRIFSLSEYLKNKEEGK